MAEVNTSLSCQSDFPSERMLLWGGGLGNLIEKYLIQVKVRWDGGEEILKKENGYHGMENVYRI